LEDDLLWNYVTLGHVILCWNVRTKWRVSVRDGLGWSQVRYLDVSCIKRYRVKVKTLWEKFQLQGVNVI